MEKMQTALLLGRQDEEVAHNKTEQISFAQSKLIISAMSTYNYELDGLKRQHVILLRPADRR
jgi:hypothetical protein